MAIKTTKILVPPDDSKNPIRGLDMAIHIARQYQGTIAALTVKSCLESSHLSIGIFRF